ncbi:hypothetical protein BH10ACT9_BH10ACT9_38820 [soil metagenome]
MTESAQDNTDRVVSEQRPVVLLSGLAAGFASVSLTLGTYWIFAPIFPGLVAAIAALVPIKGHFQFARGALAALLGVTLFVVVFATLFALFS